MADDETTPEPTEDAAPQPEPQPEAAPQQPQPEAAPQQPQPEAAPPQAAPPAPAPAPVAAAAPPPPPPERRRRVPTAVVLVAIVAIMALIVGATFALRGDDNGKRKSDRHAPKAFSLKQGEIFLENAASVGPDPYSGEVFGQPITGTTVAPSSTTSTTTRGATTTTSRPGAATVVTAHLGGEPGLYGGTQNQSRCDAQQMLYFLQSNPDKAQAWVAAQNADPTFRWDGPTPLRVGDLPAYFATLTPVHLTQDTRVTNHGFFHGRPTPRQSVLQAGTAVLVDRYGVPRARCACGNPLTPPQPVPVRPTYVGVPWPGFAPTNVVVVQDNHTEINVFVINDVNTGEPIVRPAGTNGSSDTPSTTTTTTIPLPPGVTLGEGDVQVTLQWVGDADMDLHVTDPSGFEISFNSKQAPSGGALDVDQIPGCGSGDAPHVENVFWPSNGAPAGQYQAFVRQYDACGHAQSFVLIVRVRGEIVQNLNLSLSDGGTSDPVTFSV